MLIISVSMMTRIDIGNAIQAREDPGRPRAGSRDG